MKKFVGLVLILVIMININSYGFCNDDSVVTSKDIYVYSNKLSVEDINSIKKKTSNFLLNISSDLDLLGISDNSIEKLYIGQPFNIYQYNNNDGIIDLNIYYIPVFYKNDIIAFFQMKNNNNQWILNFGEFFAQECKKIKEFSSKEKPVLFLLNEGNLLAINEYSSIELITRNTSLEECNNLYYDLDYSQFEDDSIVNIFHPLIPEKEKLSTKNIYKDEEYNLIYKCLPVESVPQGNWNWCAQAAVATVTNYIKGTSYTAEDITKIVHGSIVDEGMTRSELNDFLSNQEIKYKYCSNPRSYSQVMSDIDNGRLVLMLLECTSSDEFHTQANHAITINGYMQNYMDESNKWYMVCNPWYDKPVYYEVVDEEIFEYDDGGYHLKWIDSNYDIY